MFDKGLNGNAIVILVMICRVLIVTSLYFSNIFYQLFIIISELFFLLNFIIPMVKNNA